MYLLQPIKKALKFRTFTMKLLMKVFLLFCVSSAFFAGKADSVTIRLVCGDITKQQFDCTHGYAAIVNAANEPMLGGGGIDGVVTSLGGQGLAAERLAVPEALYGVRCSTGQARLTNGYGINGQASAVGYNAQQDVIKIIHTVGPRGINPVALSNAYANSLRVADARMLAANDSFLRENNCNRVLDRPITTVAFCSISTGIYGYAIEQACPVAVQAVADYFAANAVSSVQEVRFVAFSENDYAVYKAELENVTASTLRDCALVIEPLKKTNGKLEKGTGMSLFAKFLACLGLGAVGVCTYKHYAPVEKVSKPQQHDRYAYSLPRPAVVASAPLITSIVWGKICVQETSGFNKVYDATTSKDCKLSPKGSKPWNWSLTNMHHSPGIRPIDVQELVDDADVFILSRGMDLVLQVLPATVTYLESKGKVVHVLQTQAAVKLYNELVLSGKRVAALIHSTC